MKQKFKIMIISAIIFILLALSLGLLYLHSEINKYKHPCDSVNFDYINDSTGSTMGGYTCFRKEDRVDVYFNPIKGNCFGCSDEEYHFICYDKPRFCFLVEKFIKVDGGVE